VGNVSTPTPPPGNGCSYEGQLSANFTQINNGALGRFEGVIEVCIGGVVGSVCDIGWNEAAAQAVCRDRFGSNYGTLYCRNKFDHGDYSVVGDKHFRVSPI
jgi:hypothetical protein